MAEGKRKKKQTVEASLIVFQETCYVKFPVDDGKDKRIIKIDNAIHHQHVIHISLTLFKRERIILY